ncbi:MAG: tetratricopeptide repeat protein [Alphaproteobacteria bacterium]
MITRTEEAIIPFRRGLAAMESGRLEDALALFDDVVAKAPDFAEGWNKRATVLYLLGRLRESAVDVARTLDLEPRHFGALAGLGLIRRTEGRDAEALAAFEQGLKVNPHMPNIEAQARELRRKVRGRAI